MAALKMIEFLNSTFVNCHSSFHEVSNQGALSRSDLILFVLVLVLVLVLGDQNFIEDDWSTFDFAT